MAVVERTPTLPLGAMWLQVAGGRKRGRNAEIGTTRAIRYARQQSPAWVNPPSRYGDDNAYCHSPRRSGAQKARVGRARSPERLVADTCLYTFLGAITDRSRSPWRRD